MKKGKVNYNSMNTWLEPYIGMSLDVVKRNNTSTYLQMDYGTYKSLRKVSSKNITIYG